MSKIKSVRKLINTVKNKHYIYSCNHKRMNNMTNLKTLTHKGHNMSIGIVDAHTINRKPNGRLIRGSKGLTFSHVSVRFVGELNSYTYFELQQSGRFELSTLLNRETVMRFSCQAEAVAYLNEHFKQSNINA